MNRVGNDIRCYQVYRPWLTSISEDQQDKNQRKVMAGCLFVATGGVEVGSRAFRRTSTYQKESSILENINCEKVHWKKMTLTPLLLWRRRKPKRRGSFVAFWCRLSAIP